MSTRSQSKTALILLVVMMSFFLVFYLAIQSTCSEPQIDRTDTSNPARELSPKIRELSPEARELLEEIKTGAASTTPLKSGVIEFSITLSQATRDPRPSDTDAPYVYKDYWLEETGYWHIIYRFQGASHFYDIKTRKKMEFHGHPLQEWQETHFQYQIKGITLHAQERIGDRWKPHGAQKLPSPLLEDFFYPHWWIWQIPSAWIWQLPGEQLTRLLDTFPPIDIQRTHEIEPSYHLTLFRRSAAANITGEIWLDPQRGYHPIRFFKHVEAIEKIPPNLSEKIYTSSRSVYDLAEFESIWFPKNIITEISFQLSDKKQSIASPPTFRKQNLRVHRAIFNIPIEAKDLRINPDE